MGVSIGTESACLRVTATRTHNPIPVLGFYLKKLLFLLFHHWFNLEILKQRDVHHMSSSIQIVISLLPNFPVFLYNRRGSNGINSWVRFYYHRRAPGRNQKHIDDTVILSIKGKKHKNVLQKKKKTPLGFRRQNKISMSTSLDCLQTLH